MKSMASGVWCCELRCSSAQRGSRSAEVTDLPLAGLLPCHWMRCCCRAVSTLLGGRFFWSLFLPCAIAALYLYLLLKREPGQTRGHGGEDAGQWILLCLKCSPRGESWYWIIVCWSANHGALCSCNPLSFLNMLDESSSHFCLPYAKRASVSHLRWRAVSTEKSIVWWICPPGYWLIYIPGVKTWNLYHV